MTTTFDKLLGGRFAVEQPKKGYRIAVDTLLLAAASPAKGGERVLDLGCGVGGVMLALAARVEGLCATGIERQSELAVLCQRNIERNGFSRRLDVITGDLRVPDSLLRGAFDHVVANPPYHDERKHQASADPSKKQANTQSEADDLALWLQAARRALRPEGTLSMIHRADRQEEIVALAAPLFTALTVKPVWSKADGTCKRILLRAVKGVGPVVAEEGGQALVELKTVAPFVLFAAEGRYTPEAEALLRGASPMAF